MMSGILWILDFITFMFTFYFNAENSQVHTMHLVQWTPLKKPGIVMNKMFSVFGVDIHNRTMLWHIIGIMGSFTPVLTFQSALLHISIPNTSKLTTWTLVYIPRNYCPILGNNAIHFWIVLCPISLLYVTSNQSFTQVKHLMVGMINPDKFSACGGSWSWGLAQYLD